MMKRVGWGPVIMFHDGGAPDHSGITVAEYLTTQQICFQLVAPLWLTSERQQFFRIWVDEKLQTLVSRQKERVEFDSSAGSLPQNPRHVGEPQHAHYCSPNPNQHFLYPPLHSYFLSTPPLPFPTFFLPFRASISRPPYLVLVSSSGGI